MVGFYLGFKVFIVKKEKMQLASALQMVFLFFFKGGKKVVYYQVKRTLSLSDPLCLKKGLGNFE
jgi:hypothetical protein